jgi:hypothetical protein
MRYTAQPFCYIDLFIFGKVTQAFLRFHCAIVSYPFATVLEHFSNFVSHFFEVMSAISVTQRVCGVGRGARRVGV